MLLETRVPFPGTNADTYKGGLYMISKEQEEYTTGDEGVEWLVNESFDNTDGHMGKSSISGVEIPHKKGQYTHKRYYLSSWLPKAITYLLPKKLSYIEEESWNCNPYGLTVSTNPFLTKFKLIIESNNIEDNGNTENALFLNEDELKEREVILIDFMNSEIDSKEFNSITEFHNNNTDISPLSKTWMNSTQPISCCYRITKLIVPYFGIETIAKSILRKKQVELLISHARKMWINQKEWNKLTMEDIRDIEKKQMDQVNSKLHVSEKSSQ
ncbi:hypothetical protein WA158_008471 [Blastocystis sp. Blastoise]